jgi:hypothetical protein
VGALYIEGAGSLLNKGIVLSAKYKLMSECSVHAYSGLLLLQLQFWWSVHGVNSLFDFAAPCPLMIWLTWQLAHLLNSIATPADPIPSSQSGAITRAATLQLPFRYILLT